MEFIFTGGFLVSLFAAHMTRLWYEKLDEKNPEVGWILFWVVLFFLNMILFGTPYMGDI